MTSISVQDVTQTIEAVTGLGTLMFMIFSWIMLRRAAVKVAVGVAKVEEMHAKQDELIEHTNGLTTLLMEKTDVAARAEGVKEGVAQQLAITVDAHAGLLAQEAAEAAAKIIRVAAEKAAELLAATGSHTGRE